MVRIYRYTFETATLIWGIYNEYGYKAISINHELLFTCFFLGKYVGMALNNFFGTIVD